MPDLVLGMGEVGSTIFALLEERGHRCAGMDMDPDRCRNPTIQHADLLHICIPGDLDEFSDTVVRYADAHTPDAILLHSTVRPGTAAAIQGMVSMPVISAPARGVHRRFIQDMKLYTKFLACDVSIRPDIKAAIKDRFVKVTWMSSTRTAELAKILTDTTYYGWLINYAQITSMICQKEGIDYDEMWTFAEEPHKYLGNRPKMFPGVIGGHCVIPNLYLTQYKELQAISTINEIFRKYTGAP